MFSVLVFQSLSEAGQFSRDNAVHRYILHACCFSTCTLYRYTLAFVVGPVLQRDISEFVHDWNTHLVRKNKHGNAPCGRPIDLYDMPGLQGIHISCNVFVVDT